MTVRIGMFGAGGIAQAHLRVLTKMEHVEVVGIYDVSKESAEKLAQEANAKACSNLEELLDGLELDALFVCVPQFARGNIEEMVAERGIHLFAEKPLGLDAEVVRRKEKLIRSAGIMTSSGYVFRYLDFVEQAEQLLAEKQLSMIVSHRFGGMHSPKWWWSMKQSGGQLVDQTTHQVDLIRYLAGEFTEVSARYAQRTLTGIYEEATIPDVGVMTFTLESGAIGSLSQSCNSTIHRRMDVEFFGSDFYMAISGRKLYINNGQREYEIEAKASPMEEQDRSFIEAIRTGQPDLIRCNYSDALKTLEVTLAANKSAQSGKSVKL